MIKNETYTYEGLCNVLERNPEYRQCDEEKVEKILKEFKKKIHMSINLGLIKLIRAEGIFRINQWSK